jgi:GNAT superfamily N-acetyltransferase
MSGEILIRPLQKDDVQPIARAFAELGWNKPASQYEAYLAEQNSGQRLVLVAMSADQFAGYITICWKSHYPQFALYSIPEIVDFNVLPVYRRRGIGSQLMDAAEARVAEVCGWVGLGVGMTVDYGAAQKMYARRGYIPDGQGLMYRHQPVQYGSPVFIDDDLCLYFTKKLPGAILIPGMESE